MVLGPKFLKKRIKKSLFLWHHGAMHVILSKLKKLLLHFFKAPIVGIYLVYENTFMYAEIK